MRASHAAEVVEIILSSGVSPKMRRPSLHARFRAVAEITVERKFGGVTVHSSRFGIKRSFSIGAVVANS